MARLSIFLEKKHEIASICKRFGVRELSVFGSASRADFQSDSDLDILVEFLPGARIGLLEFGNLQGELQAVLQRKVDLVSKRGLKPLVRERVLQEAEPLYAG
jgi:predicted nucleotidyltransferase